MLILGGREDEVAISIVSAKVSVNTEGSFVLAWVWVGMRT